MPGLIPIHVISLRRRADRRAWIEEHLQHAGLLFSFFDATDALELDHEPLARLYDPARFAALNRDQPEMLPGQLACSLSHYRLWQHVATSGAPWTLVLEDDAVFTMAHPEPLLKAATTAAGPNDVVLLNSRCFGVWLRNLVALWPGSHLLYRVNADTYLSAAYLLSAGAAQRLAAAVTRDGIIRNVDWWYRRDGADWSRIVPVRVVKPDLVAQHGEMGSDIVAEQFDSGAYAGFSHGDTRLSLTLWPGLVREPHNPRYWPLFASRWLRRMYGFYRTSPRCLN